MPLPLGLILGGLGLGAGLDEIDNRRAQNAFVQQQQSQQDFINAGLSSATPGINPMAQSQLESLPGLGLDPNDFFNASQELLTPVNPLEGSFRDDIVNPVSGLPESILFDQFGNPVQNLGQAGFPPAATINNTIGAPGQEGVTFGNPGAGQALVQTDSGPRMVNVPGSDRDTKSRLDEQSLNISIDAVEQLIDSLNKVGTERFGAGSTEQAVLYRTALGGFNTLLDLGTLQPGELEFLQDSLIDPTSNRGALSRNKTIINGLETYLGLLKSNQLTVKEINDLSRGAIPGTSGNTTNLGKPQELSTPNIPPPPPGAVLNQ